MSHEREQHDDQLPHEQHPREQREPLEAAGYHRHDDGSYVWLAFGATCPPLAGCSYARTSTGGGGLVEVLIAKGVSVEFESGRRPRYRSDEPEEQLTLERFGESLARRDRATLAEQRAE